MAKKTDAEKAAELAAQEQIRINAEQALRNLKEEAKAQKQEKQHPTKKQ